MTQKPIKLSEPGSRRDRQRPRDTSVPSPRLDCADDPPGHPGPQGLIAAAAAPLLRTFVL